METLQDHRLPQERLSELVGSCVRQQTGRATDSDQQLCQPFLAFYLSDSSNSHGDR